MHGMARSNVHAVDGDVAADAGLLRERATLEKPGGA
jgi:hypothetical protein